MLLEYLCIRRYRPVTPYHSHIRRTFKLDAERLLHALQFFGRTLHKYKINHKHNFEKCSTGVIVPFFILTKCVQYCCRHPRKINRYHGNINWSWSNLAFRVFLYRCKLTLRRVRLAEEKKTVSDLSHSEVLAEILFL